MPIRLSRFEMPKGVQKDESTATATYARCWKQRSARQGESAKPQRGPRKQSRKGSKPR